MRNASKLLSFILLTCLPTVAAAPQEAPSTVWSKDFKVLSPVSISPNGDLTFIGSDTKIHRTNGQGQEKWSFATGDIGRAQPVLTPDGGVIGASYDDKVYSLSPAGQLQWSAKLDGDIYATPALRTDGSLIAATAGGTVYALGTAGQVLWTYKVNAPVFSSPAVSADGTIYFGSQGGDLTALRPDGKLKWSFAARSSIFSSPALDQDGNIYFGSSDRHIYSLDPAGKVRWDKAAKLFVNASPIVTSSGLVVVGSYDGNVYAVHTSGEDAWTYTAGAGIAASAAELSDGTVVVGDLNGTLHAIDKTGQALWTLATGQKIDTTVAVSDAGVLYYALRDGTLNATAKGRPLAVGAWTTFRGTPAGWGRSLRSTELAALTKSRQTANALVATAPVNPAPPPKSPVLLPSVPGAVLGQYAAAASKDAQNVSGQLYLPLAPSLAALGWTAPLGTGGPVAAPRTVALSSGADTAVVSVIYLNRVAFVPLKSLAGLPGTVAQMLPAAGIALTRNQQTVLFPVNVAKLVPLTAPLEFSAPQD